MHDSEQTKLTTDPEDTSRIVDPCKRTRVHRTKTTEVPRVVNPIRQATARLNRGILPAESGLEAPLPGPRTKHGKAFSCTRMARERLEERVNFYLFPTTVHQAASCNYLKENYENLHALCYM